MRFPVSLCIRNEVLRSGKWLKDAVSAEDLEGRKRHFDSQGYQSFVVLVAVDRNKETEISRGKPKT